MDTEKLARIREITNTIEELFDDYSSLVDQLKQLGDQDDRRQRIGDVLGRMARVGREIEKCGQRLLDAENES